MPRPSWYWSVPVALLCLFAADLLVGFWRPTPQRLPEQFSPAYLERLVKARAGTSPIVFLGDSVLWGYKVPAGDATASIIATQYAPRPILNLSYEGGSSSNTYFMLRYLLASGVHPALVVFNVNSKESNAEDSAYRRLHPSLEPNVSSLFDADDRARLDLLPAPTFTQRLDAGVARVWQLYRYRTDIREAFFGYDDAATWLKNAVERASGSQALQMAEHRPTADRFLGTYDLEPLTPDNVDFTYLRELGAFLKAQHIPAIAFLTPTNHRLLHDYIDSPSYSVKLKKLVAPLREDGIRVIDLDSAFPNSQFIDNDHLTVTGNRRLAQTLGRAMHQVLAQ